MQKLALISAVAEAQATLPSAAWACSDAQLEAAGGALSGVATCSRDRRLRISGTLKCLGPGAGE